MADPSALIAELRERHCAMPLHNGRCQHDGDSLPCDAIRAADALEAAGKDVGIHWPSLRTAFEFLAQRADMPDDGCWEWRGSKTAERGYGAVRVKGTATTAHRHVWTLIYGAVPDGLFVCHRCNNKGCVRPDHLYLANNATNIRDAHRDGLIRTFNSKKTRCSRCDSEFSKDTYGRRYCKPCKAASNITTQRVRRSAARQESKQDE